MFDAFIDGLRLVFEWPSVGFLFLGIVLGLFLGVVPGLGGVIGLLILLPFTFDMDPVPAIALLLGMYSVTTTSDTITSVLLGIPGTAASQATVLDGHPLAQQGQAERAFGAAFTVSAFGGVFGALVLAGSLPLILPIILAFSKAELFMLGVLGLTMVGSLTGRAVTKGLLAACLGLFLTSIGYGAAVPVPRYYMGVDYLLDGLPILPVILGLFAIPELIDLAVRDTSISKVAPALSKRGGSLLMEGVRDAGRHWWLALRCSVIGTYIGILPGLGASIVDWIAYGHAVQSAKDKSKFGKGDIRGVIAPESANNAVKGGSLLPTVAFGIPGSLGASILLGALIIQGIQPGPSMLTAKLNITFSMVWMIVVANVVGAGLLMVLCRPISKLAFIPGHLIVPGVAGFVFMGAWLSNTTMGDWISLIVMGLVGYVMKRGGWPRPPLVLALVLGSILEQTFQISMRANGGPSWLWERPLVILIGALCVATVVLSTRGVIKAKSKTEGTGAETGEGNEVNPIISLPFAILLTALFSYAAIEALNWSSLTRLFPLAFAIPAAIISFCVVITDARALRYDLATYGNVSALWSRTRERIFFDKSMSLFAYLIAIILITLVVGQKIAIPLFIAMYLRRWGKYSWKIAAGYAAAAYFFMQIFYEKAMHLFWYPSMFSDWLNTHLPSSIPSWLFV